MKSRIKIVDKKMKQELSVIADNILKARGLVPETVALMPFLEQMDRDYYYLKALAIQKNKKKYPRPSQLDIFKDT